MIWQETLRVFTGILHRLLLNNNKKYYRNINKDYVVFVLMKIRRDDGVHVN